LKKVLQNLARELIFPVISIICALIVTGVIVYMIGEDPLDVINILFSSSFGSWRGIGYTIFYATPLIFTGLAVAFGFHCGLFNIGGEGQLYVGAFAVTIVGIYLTGVPKVIAIPIGIIAAFVGGALWALIPGLLKAKKGSHEVITTIMMNFIAVGILNWLVLNPFKNPANQVSETWEIAKGFQIPTFDSILARFGLDIFKHNPANFAFLLAILFCILFYIFLWRTKWGYEIRTVGHSESAAQYAGINVSRNIIIAMLISGGLAGLVGTNEVMGFAHKFKDGFSPQYGFLGIAVALVGRNHPVGVFLAGLLFGALHNGARYLDLDTEYISKDLTYVIEAIIILFVTSEAMFRQVYLKMKKARIG
jgi:general nucleoside transport system permease protein